MEKDSLELCKSIDKSYKLGINKMNEMIGEYYGYLRRKNPQLAKKLKKELEGAEIEEYWKNIHQNFLFASSIPSSCTRKFYETLTKYNYFIESEIEECIENLATNSTRDDSTWLQCPWIKEINRNMQKEVFHLETSKKAFTFSSVYALYGKECEEIKKQLNGQSYSYLCHFVAYQFSQMHKETYAVTSVCPKHFSNVYWFHSYNLSADQNYVIDIANGIYMPVEDFNRLIKPIIILDQTKGEEIKERLNQIQKSAWEYKKYTQNNPLKALAFFNFDSLNRETRDEAILKLTRS